MNLFHAIQVETSDKILNDLTSIACKHDLLNIFHKKSGDSLLHQAARCGKLNILITLHRDFGLNLEQQNYDGKRPLHDASQYGCLDCVKYILSKKAMVDCIKRADWSVSVNQAYAVFVEMYGGKGKS